MPMAVSSNFMSWDGRTPGKDFLSGQSGKHSWTSPHDSGCDRGLRSALGPLPGAEENLGHRKLGVFSDRLFWRCDVFHRQDARRSRRLREPARKDEGDLPVRLEARLRLSFQVRYRYLRASPEAPCRELLGTRLFGLRPQYA